MTYFQTASIKANDFHNENSTTGFLWNIGHIFTKNSEKIKDTDKLKTKTSGGFVELSVLQSTSPKPTGRTNFQVNNKSTGFLHEEENILHADSKAFEKSLEMKAKVAEGIARLFAKKPKEN